jgi:Protein of unknown function (DUF3417)
MNVSPHAPELPQRLDRLFELATDLWWTWNAAARNVFRDLDYQLWRATAHNPVKLLRLINPDLLQHAAQDPVFLRQYDAALKQLDRTRSGEGTWWAQRHGTHHKPIAYFSAEFAIHQSLPIIAKRRATSACRWWRSASCIRKATSARASPRKAGRRSATTRSTGWMRRSSWRSRPMAGPA